MTTILTCSGYYFDYVDVRSNMIFAQDIASGLSNECRYNGQCPVFYSVAEHSYMVVDIVRFLGGTKTDMQQALMHDASEAFCKDIPKPLKELLPEYKAIEQRVQRDIYTRLRLPLEDSDLVKRADSIALAIEKRDLWGNRDDWIHTRGVVIPHSYTPNILFGESPENAYVMWLDSFAELFGEDFEFCLKHAD